MKTRLMVVALIIMSITSAIAGDYTLTVDGRPHDVDLGKQTVVTLSDGQVIRVTLDKKAIATFKTGGFSFSYTSSLSPSRTDLGDGVHQTMIASPLGTIIMIQEYEGMDPSDLVDMMLKELTKEEVHYGYEIAKSPARKTLADGSALTGKLAVSKYKDTEYKRYVLSHSTRDAGIMVVTQIEKAAPREDRELIDMFWKTLKISK
jgi:hypothetical protein